jgi:hypothetical protein
MDLSMRLGACVPSRTSWILDYNQIILVEFVDIWSYRTDTS